MHFLHVNNGLVRFFWQTNSPFLKLATGLYMDATICFDFASTSHWTCFQYHMFLGSRPLEILIPNIYMASPKMQELWPSWNKYSIWKNSWNWFMYLIFQKFREILKFILPEQLAHIHKLLEHSIYKWWCRNNIEYCRHGYRSYLQINTPVR